MSSTKPRQILNRLDGECLVQTAIKSETREKGVGKYIADEKEKFPRGNIYVKREFFFFF